jgi:signal transduction histidine kinase
MSRASVAIELTVDGSPWSAPGEVNAALYRLVQEALNNVVRHAGAAHARVGLEWAAGQVRLRISDDGRGFDPTLIPPGHLGLRFMHERAAAIGASLEVASRPGTGTVVTISWPAEDSLDRVSGPVLHQALS